MLENEKNLIKGAKKGEVHCFDKLYSHYIPQIYRFVFIKVSNKQEAEDLVHEVFLSAWQNIYRYKSRGFPFSSWLYQIARNRVIDYYRLRKDNVSLDTAEVAFEFIKTENPIELQLDRNFELDKIKSAIHSLENDQQDVVLMRFIEDFSPKEIASIMGRSEGSVRVIQHRAIKELKKILENGG